MKITVALAALAFLHVTSATLEEFDPIIAYFRGLRPYRYYPREEILEDKNIIEEEREILRRRDDTLKETPLRLNRILDPYVVHSERILDPYLKVNRILDPYFLRWINRGFTGIDRVPYSWLFRGRERVVDPYTRMDRIVDPYTRMDRIVDPYFSRWSNRMSSLEVPRVPEFDRFVPRVWGSERILDPYYRGLVDRITHPYFRFVNRIVNPLPLGWLREHEERVNEEIERPIKTNLLIEQLREIESVLKPYFGVDRIVRDEMVRDEKTAEKIETDERIRHEETVGKIERDERIRHEETVGRLERDERIRQEETVGRIEMDERIREEETVGEIERDERIRHEETVEEIDMDERLRHEEIDDTIVRK